MFMVWNATDELYAWPEAFETKKQAEGFAARFRRRFETQGYYFTFDRRRIPPEDLELIVVPADD